MKKTILLPGDHDLTAEKVVYQRDVPQEIWERQLLANTFGAALKEIDAQWPLGRYRPASVPAKAS